MSKPLPLPVRDRSTGRVFQEFMDDSPETYESEPHRSFMQQVQSHPAVDWLIAADQDTPFSARFERRFRPGKRSFAQAPGAMGAFADARYRSAVVLFGERGRWVPEHDLLENTQNGLETFVRLGETIAHKL